MPYDTRVLSLLAVPEHIRLGNQPRRGIHDVFFPLIRECSLSREEDGEVA